MIKLSDLPAPPAGRTGWPWTEALPLLPERLPDGAPWPRVTLVTPSYNQAEFLEETIRSVLLQGYPDLEYIVVDGGSSDGSLEILKRYDAWITSWVSEKDRGQTHALNKGFAQATGEVVGWVNSDDYLLPGAVKSLAELSQREAGAVAWVGVCQLVDREGKLLSRVLPRVGSKRDFAVWHEAAGIGQPACFFRRSALEAVGGLKEQLHLTMDVDLWIRLAEQGRFATTQEDIACSRIYEGIKSFSDFSLSAIEHICISFSAGEHEAAKEHLVRYVEDHLAAMPRTKLLSWLAGLGARSVWRRIRPVRRPQ